MSRRTALALTIAALLVAVAALSWRLAGAGARPELEAAPGASTASDVDPARIVAASNTAAPAQPVPPERAPISALELEVRLVCLRAADRRPVAGVSLFVQERRVAGPTEDDGVLDLEEAPREACVWGPGWTPVFLPRGRPLPAEVLLEPADAALAVRLENLALDRRVVRTLLQPTGWHATGQAVWEPELVLTGPDRLMARGVPPGAYDVYVWTGAAGDAADGIGPVRVELLAGRTTDLVFDATVLPEDD